MDFHSQCVGHGRRPVALAVCISDGSPGHPREEAIAYRNLSARSGDSGGIAGDGTSEILWGGRSNSGLYQQESKDCKKASKEANEQCTPSLAWPTSRDSFNRGGACQVFPKRLDDSLCKISNGTAANKHRTPDLQLNKIFRSQAA